MIELYEGDKSQIGRYLCDAAAMEYNAADTREVFALVALLKPTIKQDGDRWCILLGDDLQAGIAGFGPTIWKAAIDFNGAFQREPKGAQP